MIPLATIPWSADDETLTLQAYPAHRSGGLVCKTCRFQNGSTRECLMGVGRPFAEGAFGCILHKERP